MLAIGEYRPDVADFQGTTTRYINNLLPQGDGYGPVKNLQAFTSALGSQCKGAYYARQTDGSISIWAATATRLWKLNNTTLVFADVSKGATDYSALSTGANWVFNQFGDYLVAVQENVVPQYISISAGSAFGDLAGSPPQAAYSAVVGRFLILGGLLSNRNRVQWSDLDNVTQWTSGIGFSNYVDFPDGGVVRGLAGGEFGMVLQENTKRTLTYVPGAKPAFQIERIADEAGLVGPYSVARAGGRVFFYSANGFQMYTTGIGITPIGKERVDRTFAADIDLNSLNLFIAAPDPLSTRVYWAYRSVNGGSTAAFDKAIVYDYGLDRWAPISVAGEYLMAMTKPGITLESLDSIGNLDALPFSLDAVPGSTAIAQSLAAIDATHKVSFFAGTNMEAIAETPEQAVGGSSRVMIRGFRPITDAPTVYGSLEVRSIQGGAMGQTTEQVMNTLGYVPQRVDTRYARARVRIPSGTSWSFVSGVEPDFSPVPAMR